MGHNGESPNTGMGIVKVSFLSCIVFNHFAMTVQKFFPKIRSPRVRCLVISNAAEECDRMLDNLMKEKKQNKYNALYMTGPCRALQIVTIWWTISMETSFTVLGLKTALILRDLMYKDNLSSLKGSVFKPCTINIALIADM